MTAVAPAGPRAAFWAVAVLALPGAVMFTIVNPAIPLLQAEYDAPPSALSWLVTGYLITSTVSAALSSQLIAAVGARGTMIAGVLAVVVGGVIATSTDELWIAVVGRCLQGGSGLVVPTSLAVVRQVLPAARTAPAYATLSTVGAVGGGAGLLLGGPLASAFSGRAVFWAPAIVALITLVAVFAVPTTGRSSTRADVAGIALSSIGVSLVIAAVSFARQWYPSPWLAVITVAGVACLVAWVLVERRVEHPMIELGMLGRHGNALIMAVAFLTGGVMIARLTTMPSYVQTPVAEGGLGMDPSVVGFVMAPTSVCVLLGGYLVRRTVVTLGPRTLMLGSALVLAVGAGMFLPFHTHPVQIGIGSALCGIGIGGVLATITPLILRSVPIVATAAVVSAVTIMRSFGSSFGSQLPVSVLGGPEPVPLGLVPADHLVIAAGCAIAMGLAAVLVVLIPRRAPAPEEPAG